MSDLRERVGRVICRAGGMTWDDHDLSASTRRVTQEAYRTLADAAIAEVLTWQSEQAVAAAGPDPFLIRREFWSEGVSDEVYPGENEEIANG